MEAKPFKTFKEQCEYLNEEKGIITDFEKHKEYLIKIGYFNIINAYKLPFVDRIEVDKDGKSKHFYMKNTYFEYLLRVYEFDSSLRRNLFIVLTNLEQEIKNLYAYIIGLKNTNNKEWHSLDLFNYSKTDEEIENVINSIKNRLDHKNNYKYLGHYKDKYGELPIWIVLKNIMLSDFIDFIKIMSPDVNGLLSKVYDFTYFDDDREKIDFKNLINYLNLIREYRNACAHTERTYHLMKTYERSSLRSSAGFNKFMKNPIRYTRTNNNPISLIDLLVCLKYFLKHSDYYSLINKIVLDLEKLKEDIPLSPYEKVLSDLGAKSIEDLAFLANNNLVIPNYHILG